MANLKVDTISGIGTEGPVLNGGLHFRSKNYLTLPKGTTTERIATSSGISTVIGAIRYNTDSNKMECYVNNKWMIVATSSPTLNGGTRGLLNAHNANTIEFITVETAGNSVDFADDADDRATAKSVGSRTRAIFAGGGLSGGNRSNVITFCTFSTQSNAQDFGDLTQAGAGIGNIGMNNTTRGVFPGRDSPTTNTIDFITIATTGNAIDFGDTSLVRTPNTFSSPTRGIMAGNFEPGYSNVIEFITTATTGNSRDFGDLTVAKQSFGASSNSVRGIFAGGRLNPSTRTDDIELLIPTTLGNAILFGDLAVSGASQNGGVASSPVRAVITGSYTGSESNNMEYLAFATGGSTINFGDLSSDYSRNAVSNGNGGL